MKSTRLFIGAAALILTWLIFENTEGYSFIAAGFTLLWMGIAAK